MQWRNPSDSGAVYDCCKPITLPMGLVISVQDDGGTVLAEMINQAWYRQSCYLDSIPMLDTNVGYLMNEYTLSLPLMEESWYEWTLESGLGNFAYSVVPVVYSISVLAVITWFLTIFVLTNYTIKASFLLRALTILSSIYLLVTVVLTIVVLGRQQAEGYLHGAKLLDYINSSKLLNILDFLVVILLQINQAQVLMRIFQRQADKRLALYVGILSTLTSQIIWAITRFYNFKSNSEAGDILPAFIYLVRIAIGVCYASLVSVYIFTKINLIIANRSIWLLSLLTLILIYSPVAFFIADVSNSWVSELSEVFQCVTYVICVVLPWEWCNKLNLILKFREKEGLLGRRFYEDELYELDRYELFMDEDEPNHSNNQHGSTGQASNTNDINFDNHDDGTDDDNEIDYSAGGDLKSPKRYKIISILGKTKDTLLNITDVVLATGLAIPRSVSVNTPPINVARGNTIQLETFGTSTASNTNGDTGATPGNSTFAGRNIPGRNRRDVFVYTRKEVVINDDESVT